MGGVGAGGAVVKAGLCAVQGKAGEGSCEGSSGLFEVRCESGLRPKTKAGNTIGVISSIAERLPCGVSPNKSA